MQTLFEATKRPGCQLTDAEWEQISAMCVERHKGKIDYENYAKRDVAGLLNKFADNHQSAIDNDKCLFCGDSFKPVGPQMRCLCRACYNAIFMRGTLPCYENMRKPGIKAVRVRLCRVCKTEPVYAREMCKSCYHRALTNRQPLELTEDVAAPKRLCLLDETKEPIKFEDCLLVRRDKGYGIDRTPDKPK